MGILGVRDTRRQAFHYRGKTKIPAPAPEKIKKARNPAVLSAAESGHDRTSQKECGALAPQRERRTKTHSGKLPFSDGLDQPCLVYQSALIGVK
jgi:hypothetical protein